MTKINDILKRFDEEFGQSKAELVNCELPLEMPIILKRNIITGNVGYEELPIAVKQFLLTAIKEVLAEVLEKANRPRNDVSFASFGDIAREIERQTSQINKELNK